MGIFVLVGQGRARDTRYRSETGGKLCYFSTKRRIKVTPPEQRHWIRIEGGGSEENHKVDIIGEATERGRVE